MRKKIAELKKKSKPKTDARIEEIKRKVCEENSAMMKQILNQQESIAKTRMRQSYEQDRIATESRINQEYEQKYRDMLEKIEKERIELQKWRSQYGPSLRKLQQERKAVLEEFESKDFDLTKKEIELKGELESIEQIKQQTALIRERKHSKKPSVDEDMRGTSLFLGKSKNEFMNNSQTVMKRPGTRMNADFMDTSSRILLHSSELIDKAINDIGLEDIVARVVSRSEMRNEESMKKDDFLIQSRNELDDIADYH